MLFMGVRDSCELCPVVAFEAGAIAVSSGKGSGE